MFWLYSFINVTCLLNSTFLRRATLKYIFVIVFGGLCCFQLKVSVHNSGFISPAECNSLRDSVSVFVQSSTD